MRSGPFCLLAASLCASLCLLTMAMMLLNAEQAAMGHSAPLTSHPLDVLDWQEEETASKVGPQATQTGIARRQCKQQG